MFELIICTIGSAATLLAEHAMLWRKPWRLSRPAAYSVGTATLAFWFFLWSIWIGFPVVGVGFLWLAGLSGIPVIVAYWFRSRLTRLNKNSRKAGRAGARPLRQEDIDRGRYGTD